MIFEQVYKDLMMLAGGEEPIICCFEKPNEFCHRQLVATWLEKNLNIEIKEFKHEELIREGGVMIEKKPLFEQGSLF